MTPPDEKLSAVRKSHTSFVQRFSIEFPEIWKLQITSGRKTLKKKRLDEGGNDFTRSWIGAIRRCEIANLTYFSSPPFSKLEECSTRK